MLATYRIGIGRFILGQLTLQLHQENLVFIGDNLNFLLSRL